MTVVLFSAAVLAVLSGILTRWEAYEAIDLPILVLLACLIPISDAVGRTGGALPPVGAVALVLVPALALTPFPTGTDAPSDARHSTYQRHPQDLPLQGRFLPL